MKELEACKSITVNKKYFNKNAIIPYGLDIDNIYKAMVDFTDFLSFINQQMYTKKIPRLEKMLMPANFSSIVGEFMGSNIPKYCSKLIKNQYHNGHPDLIEKGKFENDAVQHHNEGIEIKASRYLKGWQGHNPEDVWLMVFIFDCNRPTDTSKGIENKPFRFLQVVGAKLKKSDWLFAGRSETSRRTITASVTQSGYEKMINNWIYIDPDANNSSSHDLSSEEE